jgi:hypothetical protein
LGSQKFSPDNITLFKIDKTNKLKHHYNSKFEETISIKNVYNRMLSYDASSWHCANNYWTDNEPRLCQLFFVYKLSLCNTAPSLVRLQQNPDFLWNT